MRSLSVTRKNFGILSVSERLQRADPKRELSQRYSVASLSVSSELYHVLWCVECGVAGGVRCEY